MYVLMNNNTVIPLQEIDVANVHDGDVLMYSWNKQYLEEIGMNLEWNKSQDIVEQYLPVSVIMDEKDFGWLERMMTRAKHNDHTPLLIETAFLQHILTFPYTFRKIPQTKTNSITRVTS